MLLSTASSRSTSRDTNRYRVDKMSEGDPKRLFRSIKAPSNSRSEHHTLKYGHLKPLLPYIDKTGQVSHRVYLGPDCRCRVTRVFHCPAVPLRARVFLCLHLHPLHGRLDRESAHLPVLRTAGNTDRYLYF